MEHVPDRSHYIDKVHEETLRYVRELLDDNDRLRLMAVRLQTQNIDLSEQLASLRRDVEIRQRAEQELEQQARRFGEQFAAIEAQNANLANLYVASYQLHGTVDREGVLQVIKEIVANLIGSEEAAVYELAPDGLTLDSITSMGVEDQRWQRITVGSGTVGTAVADNRIYIAEGGVAGRDGVTAAIPLNIDGRVIGAIVVFHLLPQKERLQEVDREMFELLALHAATALYCATLNAERQALA